MLLFFFVSDCLMPAWLEAIIITFVAICLLVGLCYCFGKYIIKPILRCIGCILESIVQCLTKTFKLCKWVICCYYCRDDELPTTTTTTTSTRTDNTPADTDTASYSVKVVSARLEMIQLHI